MGGPIWIGAMAKKHLALESVGSLEGVLGPRDRSPSAAPVALLPAQRGYVALGAERLH